MKAGYVHQDSESSNDKKMGVIAIIALLVHNVPNYNKRKNSAVHL